MPLLNSFWLASWGNPWGSSLALDGLTYNAGSITYRGDMGCYLYVESFTEPYGATIPAQTWQTALRNSTVTVVINRVGGVGSSIGFDVVDTNGNTIGTVAPIIYPGGITTVVIPVAYAGYDLSYFKLTNADYPSLGIDVTVMDLFSGAAAITPEWTNYLGCGES